MWRKAWVIGISAALAACVFGATTGFSEDTPPPRVRGTLDQVNGNMLTIKTRSGTPTTVQLKDGAPVIATVKGSMSDIQDNSFVGITTVGVSSLMRKTLGQLIDLILRVVKSKDARQVAVTP